MILRQTLPVALMAVLLAAGCSKPKSVVPWVPGASFATQEEPVYRGLLDRRGLIHAHNVNSHDACADDGSAADLGAATNQNCYNEFRTDICAAQHDFVFFSDHGQAEFNTAEYPGPNADPTNAAAAKYPSFMEGGNTMLYSQTMDSSYMGKPDQLVSRNGNAVANLVTCPNNHGTLLIPGAEGDNLMPVGLEQHVAADAATRASIYGTNTENTDISTDAIDPTKVVVPADVNNAIAAEKAAGAVVLMAHPEDMSKDEFVTYPIDGFEMYNVHNNAILYTPGFVKVLNLVAAVNDNDPTNYPANPNLILMGFWLENPAYLSRWAYTLSNGVKRVTTMGSDCHQNAIPVKMSDGEWGDRYRRVMEWFSNHLLVTPNADGSWDDTNLKAALRGGRLYGAFEMLGYPVGFDYHASSGKTINEMGDDVQIASHVVLSVKAPTVQNLNPARTPPTLTVRILRADGENWDEVASGPGDLSFTPTLPGAYRAEVRMIPNHLKEDLGLVAPTYLSHDYVWIYSNAIYVH